MIDKQQAKTKTADEKDPIADLLKRAAGKTKRKRSNLVDEWAINVDYLRGKPFEQESDSDRVYVNVDNSMARRKAAQIASQLPEARLLPKNKAAEAIAGEYAKKLNDTIRKANVGDALFETAKDAINAAGFGVVLCGYERRTETRKTLGVDPKTLAPEQIAALEKAGNLDEASAQQALAQMGIPVVDAEHTTSSRLYGRRVSPSDFLWPLEFERSNFDESPWLGHSGKMTWSEAKPAFKLTDDEKEKCCGAQNARDTNLRADTGHESDAGEDVVEYDEIFYWRAKYDPNEKYFECIWRIVFVTGLDRVPVHGQWEGQKLIDGVGYVGALKNPLRVLTLDYVSDDPIPPSDSAIARPQVNELIRSRTGMIQQRERSTPMRWHDVNRLDPLTSANLMRGTWQGSIPVKGNGNAVLGEVARANYPAEDFTFDRIIKSDVQEAWGVDSNQIGMFATGRRTAEEAKVVQANFSTQTGFQRARVAAFFNGIAEVMSGLFSLYGEDLPQPPPPDPNNPTAQPMDARQLGQQYEYWVLPDSTVLLDANQAADKLMDFINTTGKSGFVNPQPLIAKIAMLKGIDPAEVMTQPNPPKPEPLNVSIRSAEDLMNPIFVAMLIKTGQGPSPDELQAAFKLMRDAGIPPQILPPAPIEAPQPPQPGAPQGPGAPGAPAAPPPPMPADAHPDWNAMSTVTKRTE